MNKIQRIINAVLAGKIQLERQPMYCLRAVRQVIEAANDWPSGEFFGRMEWARYRTAANIRLAPQVPWARSLENAFIERGMTVPVAQARAGDTVFSRLPANEGHIGILGLDERGQLCVLENSTVRRGKSLGGNLNWVPLSKWGGLTTVGRMPDAWVFDAAPTPPVPVVPVVTAPTTNTARRVIVASGEYDTNNNMIYRDQTGQRYTADLGNGLTLIVNATDPDTVWVDVRKGTR